MRWFLISMAVAGLVAIVVFIRSRFSGNRLDVGAVSDQWIAEHHSDRSHP